MLIRIVTNDARETVNITADGIGNNVIEGIALVLISDAVPSVE